ncbi:MAG: DUF4833 domain-containing protein [Polyangiaceae bacterium]
MDGIGKSPAWSLRVLGALTVVLAAATARADTLVFGPHDVTSLFTISKSENRNEVVFAIHLNEQCEPVGNTPVLAFWRMHELGPNVVQPLLAREQGAYGISAQSVVLRNGSGGKVRMTLQALPKRPIVIETRRGKTTCDAWVTTTIAGEPNALLYNAYVKLGFFGPKSILLSGWADDRKRVLHELLAP